MNFQFYLERLYNAKDFQKFLKENKKAYPCSAFFVINKENPNEKNQQHFDYYIPSTNKMFSFKLEEDCQRTPIEVRDQKTPEKISMNYDFDFNEIEEIIKNKMQEEKVTEKIQKILLSLQHLKEKDYFIGTVFISSMGIISLHIDIEEKKIILFEKRSLLDMIKIIKK